jgi:hypothetical protein
VVDTRLEDAVGTPPQAHGSGRLCHVPWR